MRRSTTPKICSRGGRPTIRTTRWCSGAKTRCDAVSRTPSSRRSFRVSPRGSRRTASSAAIALPRTCRTCPRRSSRCSRPRRSARSGRPARPISACKASSIASDRSNRRSFLRSMAIGTTGKRFLFWTRWPRSSTGCRRSGASSSFRISSRHWGRRYAAAFRGTTFSRRTPRVRSATRSFRSTIRSTFSIRRGRPACRNASCTARAERCCSISKSSCCTAI